MANELPVSTPPTVDDALRALSRETREAVDISDNLNIVFTFLNRLAKMGEPAGVIDSEEQGYIIDGAMQNGFNPIDDNADLFVVHNNDLIKYVMARRQNNKATNALRAIQARINGVFDDPDLVAIGLLNIEPNVDILNIIDKALP